MSQPKPPVGSIGWIDLTVPNADEVRDFYAQVTGWQPEALDMGEYSDYVMKAPNGEGKAGVCHARGGNASMPPQWIIYIVVENIDESIARCTALGGKVIVPVRSMGEARYGVIQDPAGAVAALYQA